MATLNETHCHHHFEWGVVLAGTVIATTLSVIFMQFGSIVGLSSDAVLSANVTMTHWAVIAIGLWILATQMAASAVGGYTAGRLRSRTPDLTPHENEVRDGFYGLSVWATSTAVVAVVAGISALVALFIDSEVGPLDITPDLADREQSVAIIFAFILGSSSLVSAVIAWACATLGGDHRDTGKDFTHCLSFKCCCK
ncbi:MAG: hypothetical protein R3D88_04630 [Alphaproteobacteria bacterium]|nr:hypothetical protein [Alphaproteobacteria bacterium]